MVMMGVSNFWQMVIKGIVIIAAVIIDQMQENLQHKVVLMSRTAEANAAAAAAK